MALRPVVLDHDPEPGQSRGRRDIAGARVALGCPLSYYATSPSGAAYSNGPATGSLDRHRPHHPGRQGAALGIAAQAFLVWVIIGYVMPFFGLELLGMARDVADFNLPARVGQLFGVSL